MFCECPGTPGTPRNQQRRVVEMGLVVARPAGLTLPALHGDFLILCLSLQMRPTLSPHVLCCPTDLFTRQPVLGIFLQLSQQREQEFAVSASGEGWCVIPLGRQFLRQHRRTLAKPRHQSDSAGSMGAGWPLRPHARVAWLRDPPVLTGECSESSEDMWRLFPTTVA